jgi:CheY-like chemotaxis protein
MNSTQNSHTVSADAKQYPRVERRQRVLVVDDESIIADTITKILSLSGYAATAAYDGNEALESALLAPPHLLLTDVVLPGMNGIELAQTVRRVYPDCKILLFSGQASTIDLLTSAHRAGHRFTLLSKPIPPEELLAQVARHLNPSSEEAPVSTEPSHNSLRAG